MKRHEKSPFVIALAVKVVMTQTVLDYEKNIQFLSDALLLNFFVQHYNENNIVFFLPAKMLDLLFVTPILTYFGHIYDPLYQYTLKQPSANSTSLLPKF
jgi:hypothetical protein